MKIKISKIWLNILGALLIGYALFPTPDDVTIIAPISIFSAGLGLIYKAQKK